MTQHACNCWEAIYLEHEDNVIYRFSPFVLFFLDPFLDEKRGRMVNGAAMCDRNK